MKRKQWIRGASWLCGVTMLATGACGDESEPACKDDHEPGEGPLYVVATSFMSGDQTETYFVTTPSLEAGGCIDPTHGPRLLGGVVPLVHGGSVYAPIGNRLVRYDLDADDNLKKADEFEVRGTTEVFSWHLWIVDDEKGYIFDPAGLRILIWNPSSMTLTGREIDLSETGRDGWVPNLVLEHSGPAARGSQLLIPLGWTDEDANSRYASGVLILDTDADEVVAIDEDERCGETYATVEGPGGDIYFFPPDWSAAPHYFYDEHRPTCVLRVRAGADGFDEGEPLDLSALGTDSAAAGAMPDGEGGFFFIAADEQLWNDGGEEGAPFWQVWHHDFESGESERVDDLPAWAGQLYYVDAGGQYLVPFWEETEAGEHTVLYDLQPGRAPKAMLSFDANWYGLGKLR